MPVNMSSPVGLKWYMSRTCEGGACVMVAADGDNVLFGNTSDPDGPVVSYTKAEWHEFVAGVKLGDFEGIA